jgi:hypothetical protein
MSDYENSSLWESAFSGPKRDRYGAQRTYFREQYQNLRLKVAHLVEQIPKDIPGLTVHDITHLDALWETASTIAGVGYPINPAEAYVFGAAVLLHDAGMALASYPNGPDEIKETSEWRDGVAAELRNAGLDQTPELMTNPPENIRRMILAQVLRSLHAKRAEQLPAIFWKKAGTDQEYLIDDGDLRAFYGSVIGRIAASHHLPVSKLPEHLQRTIGAIPRIPNSWTVDSLKLACLLRAADAAQIDERRAPRFLRLLVGPEGVSAEHWSFQSKLAKPRLEGDLLVFTSGPEFTLADADAWWLCFDTVCMVDNELRDCDVLLENHRLRRFAAKRVKGAESPTALSELIRTSAWEPVDTAIKVGDVPRLVRMLGGSHLYGDNDYVALRELIQNGADAIRARRLLEDRPLTFGRVRLWVAQKTDGWWLIVDDDGVGMSARTLTGALLDFGKSFWSSEAVRLEFPGLIAKGMNPIGRYGIGFFSVFMLGELVHVTSRRYDAAQEETHTLEFRGGLSMRPILRPANSSEYLLVGGTRVSVKLKKDPLHKDGFLGVKNQGTPTTQAVQQILSGLCPSVDMNLDCGVNTSLDACIKANDWMEIDGTTLLLRIDGKDFWKSDKNLSAYGKCVRPLVGSDGTVHGRACIAAAQNYSWVPGGGVIAVGGFAATRLNGLGGILVGSPQTAARDSAVPTVPADVLSSWATQQAELLADSPLSGGEKLKIAGFVLQCGGEIGRLPVALRGGDYLNADEVRALLRDSDRIELFNGMEVEYDEDSDSCHPRDFKDNFRPDPEIFFVDSLPQPMATVHGQPWPKCVIGDDNLFSYEDIFMQLVEEMWGGIEEDADDDVVGTVDMHDEIKRPIVILRRPD